MAFLGFHDQHMAHPLLVLDGETGQLVTALLRPGRAHAARGAATSFERLLRACGRALRALRELFERTPDGPAHTSEGIRIGRGARCAAPMARPFAS